jgi:hypothetical protein
MRKLLAAIKACHRIAPGAPNESLVVEQDVLALIELLAENLGYDAMSDMLAGWIEGLRDGSIPSGESGGNGDKP